jgi:serine/threonine protein kinase
MSASSAKSRIILTPETNQTSCGPGCLRLKYKADQTASIALGGTRPNDPGHTTTGGLLIVSNVFTRSNRLGFPVQRSFMDFEKVLQRLEKNPIAELVTIVDHCTCSTAMEYLEGYQLLDNRSVYTPPQHRSIPAWADQHSVTEGRELLNHILKTVKKLHELDIIHTDVTGFNIFVRPNGEFKILDLFSCLTVDAVKPSWLPYTWKKAIGLIIERRQTETYLLAPLAERWNEPLLVDWLNYKLK